MGIKFACFLSSYMLCYSSLVGFSSVYLQSVGCTNTELGAYFSVSSFLCVALQGKIGSFLDNTKKWKCWDVVLALDLITACIALALFFAKGRLLVLVLFTLACAICLTGFTCCANFAMDYINSGYGFNYAVSRGIASFMMATSSLVLGYVIKIVGIRVIFPIYFVEQILLLISLRTLPRLANPVKIFVEDRTDANQEGRSETDQESRAETNQENRIGGGYREFLSDKKWFLVLMISFLCIYMSYTGINNFLIVIVQNVGGDSQTFGMASALAGYLELPATLLFTRAVKKFGMKKLLALSCFFFLCRVIAFTLASNVWQVYLAELLQFFSYCFFTSTSIYFVNAILHKGDKFKGQSMLSIFTVGLSGVIVSFLSGVLIDIFDITFLLKGLCYLTAVGLVGVLAVLRYIDKKQID